MADIEVILEEFFNIDLTFDSQNRYVLFVCAFLFVTALLRFLFWKISPVVYEFALILVFFGIGRWMHANDTNGEYETANDTLKMKLLHFLIPVFVFTATFEFNTAFGSYIFMCFLLLTLVPVFVLNLLFISWVMYVVFENTMHISFLEMNFITLILSPIQLQYIVNFLESAQGCTSEFRFKMRAEQYSSIWLSFLILDVLHKISAMSKQGRYSSLMVVVFVLFQLVGIVIGFITSRLLKYPLKKATEMQPPIYAVAITIGVVYVIQMLCVVIGTSHTLAVGAFGIAVNVFIMRATREAIDFFLQYWSGILFLVNSLTVSIIGSILGYAEHDQGLGILRIVFIYYIVFLSVRMVLVMICAPAVSMIMHKPVDWRYAFIQGIGVYKGGPTYILALYYAMMASRNWYNVLQLAVIFTLLSQALNVLFFPLILKILRMYDYSAARIANMNIAMADTNNCREKAIFALKMDKVFRCSNWPVVEAVTRLNFPYKKRTTEQGQIYDRDDNQIRSVVCPDCKTEILAQPNKREIDAMKKEARERIIKSQQVSFHRQYEVGCLTISEFDYLSSLVETEAGGQEPKLRPERIKIHSNMTKFIIQIKRALLWLSRLTAETYHFVPQSTIRNWCFQISTSRYMRIAMALITLVDTALIITQVMIYLFCYENGGNIPNRTEFTYSPINWNYGLKAQFLHVFFYTLSIIEFIVSLLGLGFDQYFSRNVNKIEFVTAVVLGTVEIMIFAEQSVRMGREVHPFLISMVMLIKMTAPLRLAKIYILITAGIPRIIESIDDSLAEEMMQNYELGKAYLVALNRTSALLNRTVYSEAVYTELMKEIDEDRSYMSKQMGLIQKDNPSIATTIKTRHAIRYVSNAMEECIKDMKEEGVVDLIEAEAIQDSLNKNKQALRELTLISATPPEDILKNVPWLRDDAKNLNYLLENAELTSYDYGETLISAGDDPVGIHLLVSGLLKSHYVPSTTTMQLSSKFGVLPNYDFFNNVKFDQPQEAYVVSGSIIGEIGAVSGRRYDMTINCDTSVQVYFIPWDVVKMVVHEGKESLQMLSRIWKTISMRVALNILQYNVVQFQGWPPEKLLLYLNRGFVPVMPDLVGFVVTTKVEAIVLIEGLLMDRTTRKVYVAPCYIPKNIHELMLPEHSEWQYSTICDTRMLIIPSNITNEEELKGPNGIFKFKTQKTEGETPHRKVGFEVDSKE